MPGWRLETQFATTSIVCFNAGGALLASAENGAGPSSDIYAREVSGSIFPTSAQPSVNFVCQKGLWIEIAEPLTGLRMARVSSVLECFEKLCKCSRYPAVFGRTTSFTRYAHLVKSFVANQYFFK